MEWYDIISQFNTNVNKGSNAMDWLGKSNSFDLSKALQGGVSALNMFKGAKNLTGAAKTASDTVKTFNTIQGGANVVKSGSTGVGSFLKGAVSGGGGGVSLGNAVVSAANMIPGVKSDYDSGVGKAIEIGGGLASTASMIGGLSFLGPIGLGLGAAALINNLAGRRAGEHKLDASALTNTGSAYNSLQSDAATAGKKTSLLGNMFGYKGRRTNYINKRVNSLDSQRSVASAIGQQNKQNLVSAGNTMQDITNKNYQKLIGGLQTNILAAKKGTKLSTLKNIASSAKKNVIPSGALHARKNNLGGELKEAVTHKGIPVISTDNDGKITQHAEIEHSEIIFNKEVTDQLEALLKRYKDGDESAAIEAGKLLTYEILENTEDNTGLLNS